LIRYRELAAADKRGDLRQLEFVVFANSLTLEAGIGFAQASQATVRAVSHGFVGIFRQSAEMAVASGLGAAGPFYRWTAASERSERY